MRGGGQENGRRPGTENIPGIIGLDVAASTGAACHSKGVTVSHVLEAMGIPEAFARGTLRFSTRKTTTVEEIDHAAEAVVSAIRKLEAD
ncbi:MAG: hypothetical protein JRI76_01570 [Deltaproteobacteria bacterium]|nr:hypothetical protein [Deltaproteobacteria bacterium]MBW2040699.1 hypothetical protein [Deltaproteobacteria bacterium]MBW2132525.1 hypothetical protein [Deltaproteobacteria bacterium]